MRARSSTVMLLALILSMPACGDDAPKGERRGVRAATPRQCFELFREAIGKKDGAAVWSLMAASTHEYWTKTMEQVRRESTRLREMPDEDARRELEQQFGTTVSLRRFRGFADLDDTALVEEIMTFMIPPQLLDRSRNMEFISEKVEGRRAAIRLRDPRGQEGELWLVLERGSWKLDWMTGCAPR